MRYTSAQRFIVENDAFRRSRNRGFLGSDNPEEVMHHVMTNLRSGGDLPNPELLMTLEPEQRLELMKMAGKAGSRFPMTIQQFAGLVEGQISIEGVLAFYFQLLQENGKRITFSAAGAIYHMLNRQPVQYPAQRGASLWMRLTSSRYNNHNLSPWIMCKKDGNYTRRHIRQVEKGLPGIRVELDRFDFAQRPFVSPDEVAESFMSFLPEIMARIET